MSKYIVVCIKDCFNDSIIVTKSYKNKIHLVHEKVKDDETPYECALRKIKEVTELQVSEKSIGLDFVGFLNRKTSETFCFFITVPEFIIPDCEDKGKYYWEEWSNLRHLSNNEISEEMKIIVPLMFTGVDMWNIYIMAKGEYTLIFTN